MMPKVGAPLPPNPFAEFEAGLVAASAALFRVQGIRRCGQHAVINWILRNSGAPDTVFLNSCTLRRSPVKTCGQSEVNGAQSSRGWPLKRKLEQMLAEGAHPAVLISYEAGFSPALYHEGQVTQDIPNAAFTREVLVIRSFVNWLPSFVRLMRIMNPHEAPRSALVSQGIAYEISRYKDHLKAALALAGQDGFVVVDYDAWVTSPAHRLALLAQLGLAEVDNGLGDVQIYGAGSSFDGRSVAADAMDVTRRWQTMVDDSYAQLFVQIAQADDALLDLLRQAYPDNPDIMQTLHP